MLRKLGFFTGLWWVALRERDEWLERWIEKRSARIELFVYRTASFIAVAGLLAFLLNLGGQSRQLPKLFLLASAFGALTLWWRSKTWVSEYQDIFAGRLEEP
jgi:hypothetical protein